jgi:hypothetical protein
LQNWLATEAEPRSAATIPRAPAEVEPARFAVMSMNEDLRKVTERDRLKIQPKLRYEGNEYLLGVVG